MTRLLASVRTPEEALAALEGGADILDLKEPAEGALGRLPEATIRDILAAVRGRRPVSATIGDMALAPAPVRAAVAAMAESGVDIVKIGIFAGRLSATLEALTPLARTGHRLVAVLFADRRPSLALIARFAAAGFYGVMLDTADKSAGPLTRLLPLQYLRQFVARAQREGLIAGLAGSLGPSDVAALVPLGPDYLGFRSALSLGARDGPLDPAAVARLRQAIDRAAQALLNSKATAAAGAQSAASSANRAAPGIKAAKLA